DEGWRYLQGAGDIVEAVLRTVEREQGFGIDLELQQVTDGVAVFGTVEPVQRFGAWLNQWAGCIQTVFKPGNECIDLCGARSFLARRRHHPAAQLADDLLPGFRIGSDALVVQQVERQAAAVVIEIVTVAAVELEQGPLLLGITHAGALRLTGVRRGMVFAVTTAGKREQGNKAKQHRGCRVPLLVPS